MDIKQKKGNILTVFIVIVVLFWGANSLFFEKDNSNREYLEPTSYINLESKDILPEKHYDSEYKYNYRSGYTGSYGYNYDVEGYGDDGYVYGVIDTNGKYGDGYIYDEYGNELWIETEWVDYGVLEAYDEYGNWYELEVY